MQSCSKTVGHGRSFPSGRRKKTGSDAPTRGRREGFFHWPERGFGLGLPLRELGGKGALSEVDSLEDFLSFLQIRPNYTKQLLEFFQLGSMGDIFVAGGIYQDYQGRERFALLGPSLEDPPYLMVDGLSRYFSSLSPYGHLYRVEPDLTLSLIAPSHQALAWGVKAPERVIPDPELREKLRMVISLS